MPEPTKTVPGGYLVISPDDRERRRTWPDPRELDDVTWRAIYSPDSITPADLRRLVSVASSYGHIFEISQREFLPTHSAIRAALADTADTEEPIDA